jgi:pimeloyl-ACP methyl ester carboxylesterase
MTTAPSPRRSALNVEIDGDGPDLVLLHGGAGGIADLAALRERLRPGRRVIAPDQRAHGRSPDLGELTYQAMAADTAALLDELGAREADVVGWSDGGVLALLLARDRPDLVRRAVAISANVSWAPPAPAAMDDSAFDWLRDRARDDVTLPAGRDELPGAADAWPGIVEKLRTMWFAGPEITLADLATIERPVLYLAGDRDLVRHEHTSAMFAATPGASLAIVPGADHRVPQSHPDEVAGIVARFLAAEDRPAALPAAAG